jgi:peptide/nickel transport system substrate-binding protein
MIRKWRVLGVAVAAASAMLVSACAGGGAVAGGGATGATGASGDPVAGGSATVLTLSEPRTLDPTFGSNNGPGGGVIGNALFGQLLLTDPKTSEIVPSMASAFATSDGGKTFDLTLRDGLRFSDGSPLTADAVKAHWEKVKTTPGSTYAGDAGSVESTTVVSPTRLTITMVQPIPNFAYSVVTTTLNWIPKPEAVAAGAQAFDANPIGAGPFTLSEWRRQDALVVKRNPNYWDAPRPYLDQITFKPALDASQRINTVISGGADVAVESNWVNLQKAGQSNLFSEVQALSGGNYLALNTRRAPFDDVRARQAVALAIDAQALNVSVFSGAAKPVDTLFATDSPFYTDAKTLQPDKAKAQQLFDQLAAEGKPVSFTYTGTASSESKGTGESLQAQLSAFTNVTMTIQTVEYAQIAALQGTKDFDATVTSAAFLDPEPRLWTAFQGDSRVNMSGIDDPDLNAALLKGRTATTVDDRKAAYEVVEQRLEAQVPNVWISRNASGVVAGKQVGGVVQYGFGSLRADQLWVRK